MAPPDEPERRARVLIDRLLEEAGWAVQDRRSSPHDLPHERDRLASRTSSLHLGSFRGVFLTPATPRHD
jgi:hypothetical protein